MHTSPSYPVQLRHFLQTSSFSMASLYLLAPLALDLKPLAIPRFHGVIIYLLISLDNPYTEDYISTVPDAVSPILKGSNMKTKFFANGAGWFANVGHCSLVWDADRCILYVGAFGKYCIL